MSYHFFGGNLIRQRLKIWNDELTSITNYYFIYNIIISNYFNILKNWRKIGIITLKK